jgi:hypothetical protein
VKTLWIARHPFRATGIARADCSATSKMFITNVGAVMQVRPSAGADSGFPVMAVDSEQSDHQELENPASHWGLGGVKYTHPRRVDSGLVPGNRRTAVTNSQKV